MNNNNFNNNGYSNNGYNNNGYNNNGFNNRSSSNNGSQTRNSNNFLQNRNGQNNSRRTINNYARGARINNIQNHEDPYDYYTSNASSDTESDASVNTIRNDFESDVYESDEDIFGNLFHPESDSEN